MSRSVRSVARTVTSPTGMCTLNSIGWLRSTGIRFSRPVSVSAVSITIIPPRSMDPQFRGQERRPWSRQLLGDDLHPLTTVVDVDQWSAEPGGDAFPNRVHLREILRDELAGDVEAGLDQPEREGEVDHRASGRTVGDPNAHQGASALRKRVASLFADGRDARSRASSRVAASSAVMVPPSSK